MRIHKPNYTQIPNVVIDSMFNFTHTEFKILMFICRNTFGFHRGNHLMSISYFVDGTGLSRETVCNAIQTLTAKNVLFRRELGNSFTYGINIDGVDVLVGNSDQSEIPTEIVGDSDHLLVGDLDTRKETSIKKVLKKVPSAEGETVSKSQNSKPHKAVLPPKHHKAMIDLWYNLWAEHRSEIYHVTGQDARRVKEFLKVAPEGFAPSAAFFQPAIQAWGKPDVWESRYAQSLSLFLDHINELSAAFKAESKPKPLYMARYDESNPPKPEHWGADYEAVYQGWVEWKGKQ